MNNNVKKLSFAGMFTAMIFVMTLFVKIVLVQGYIHFGDAFLYICSVALGPGYGALAGAFGEALADVAGGYVLYAPATVIIKVLMALPFFIVRKGNNRLLCMPSVIASLISGAISIGGYFIYDLIIDKAYAITNIPGNLIQALGSCVIFIIVSAALDKAKITNRINMR